MAPGVSFLPQDMSAGTFLEEGVYRFTGSCFKYFEYGGKVSAKTVAFFSKLSRMKDGQIEDHDQYWSAADPDKFAPSLDGINPSPNGEGPYLCALGQGQKINESSNFALLQKSVLESGYPLARMAAADMNITKVYDGLDAHVVLRDQPRRTNSRDTSTTAPADASSPTRQIAVVTRVVALPGEIPASNTATGATASGNPAPAGASAPGSDGWDADGATIGFLVGVLTEAGGSAEKTVLMTKCFQAFSDQNQRSSVMGKLNNNVWLTGSGMVDVEGTKIKLKS